MKKITILLLLSMLFFACSDDESNPKANLTEPTIDYILGSWQDINLKGTSRFLSFNSETEGAYLIYYNGEFTFSDMFTYALDGSSITLTYDKGKSDKRELYKYNNDKLQFSGYVFERTPKE